MTEPGQQGRDSWTISELADEFGVTLRTIRHYEDVGLLTPARRGTQRVFDTRQRIRLQLVLRGKRLGFSLASIREFLDLYDADRSQGAQLRLLLDSTRGRIRELERQRVDLDQTLRELRKVETEAERVLRARDEPRPPAEAAD